MWSRSQTSTNGPAHRRASNRIEWNGDAGILIADGSHYNIIGNCIDRSGKAGINLAETGPSQAHDHHWQPDLP